jgi:drug/metabolite transporter (DMT)-like permease
LKRLVRKQNLAKVSLNQIGIAAAIGAALLFGAGTPLAKLLLGTISPWLLAGLLYLGSGLGLSLFRLVRKARPVYMATSELPWFIGAIVAGGIIAPVLLMFGLTHMSAASVSLLLNAEGVFTALLAWFAFKENVDKRIALGMVFILAGAFTLSWQGDARFNSVAPLLAILGACFAWALDNNLTRKVSLTDATWIAAVKGLVSGTVNLALAFILGSQLPPLPIVASAMLVGFLAYGVSLALFVVGLRHLGTARTGAYFSVAPFVGSAIALVLGEPFSGQLGIAASLMAVGIWLHLTESHHHHHQHAVMMHTHEHRHDEHHQHQHEPGDEFTEANRGSEKHTHQHQHEELPHDHPHFPDAHHQHKH